MTHGTHTQRNAVLWCMAPVCSRLARPFASATITLLVALALGACSQKSTPGSPAAASSTAAVASPTFYLPAAQPRLQTIKLFVGSAELSTEVAVKQHELATGMMYRTNMPENEAMLFVFGQPHRTSFYMRNTVVPLSAAYIDPDGTILELHDLQPRNETPVEASSDNIQYVLEVPQGWFSRHNVSTGAVVRSQYGALKETFSFSRK